MSPKIPLTLSFAKVANFLGIVGIIGSLVFVGLELRQNQKLAKTNAYQTRLSEMQQAQRNLAASGDLAELLVKRNTQGADSLTETELFRVRAWARSVQWRMESQYYQYKQGFLDTIALERTLDDIVSQRIYAEWEDLEGVSLDKLFNIHRIELLNKINHGNKLTNSDYILTEEVYNEVKKCYNSSNPEEVI